jgi:tetratricopeptide (TPR) repeat protein
MTRFVFCLAGLTIAGVGAILLIAASPATERQEELWRYRNLGKALFETPTTQAKAPEALKKALELAPDSFRDRLNYGISLLRTGDRKNAMVEIEKAQKQNPKAPHTWFNLGIAYKTERRYADAIRQFEGMLKLTPNEPVAHHNLGLLYELTGRKADGLRAYETAAKLDPKLVAPRFRIFNYYRLQDDQEAAARALAEFQKVKEQQQAFDESEDMEWCFYAELYDPAQARPPAPDDSGGPPLRFEAAKLGSVADAKSAGLLVLDADGDGIPDLMVWSREGVRLYRSGKDPISVPAFAELKGVLSVSAGDFNNDRLMDLCVLTETGPRLFTNSKGHFEPHPAAMPDSRFERAVWLDFDHDYDVDLFLFGESSVLMRNEGPGGFRDYTAQFPFVSGRAVDAVAFRVVPDAKGYDLAVSYAGRNATLYRDQLRGVFEPQPLEAVPSGADDLRAVDIDNDSWIDIAFSKDTAVSLALNREGRFDSQRTAASGGVAFADLENRGLADLVRAGMVHRNRGLARFAAPKRTAGLPDAVRWAAADFDSDGRLDLAAVAPDGGIHLALNRTVTKNQWLRVKLTGVKNLKSAAETEVEVKAGELAQKRIYEGVPLLFGLGPNTRVDTVRITWPNGMIQNQVNETVSRAAVIEEAPRLSGSCPMIFTWNGRGFQFITDVLGVAPLGASSGEGDFFPVDHDEYVQIPAEALVPAGGRYQVRITEELHEVSYLDQIRLFALDHPAGEEVYTNEKFKAPPFPEFRLFGVKRRITPVAARDNNGRNVLPRILARDRSYAAGFRHDHAGVAELHSLVVDLGSSAAPANDAVLYLNGWVDWADGSTFYGASQQGQGGLIFPYLQVKDGSGEWRTVIEDMGIPAGKPKTIAVDLTGRFLSASREIRIVTNLCVYWDQIFAAENHPATARMTPMDAASANLRLRGFSRAVIHPRREQPEAFEYAHWTSAASWNQTPGWYTRYGDVRELVHTIDDHMVIMGAGDELQLEFDGRGLPPLAAGWRRDFLLLVDGWAKDADANTAFSQTVEPLPFHGMSRYPYPAGERYPEDAAHRRYREQYNTRPAIRFIQPLFAAGRK